MKIKEHGRWIKHTPGAAECERNSWILGSLCARRKGGNGDKKEVDWYEYQKQFKGDTLLATVYEQPDGQFLIGTANDDASQVFPINALLIEITGWTGKNLEDLYNTPYDPKTKTLKDKPPRPNVPSPIEMAREIADLKEQVAALLKKK